MPNPNIEGGYASPYSIFETTTFDNVADTGHRLGSRGVLDDRVFRWTKFSAATAIGPNKIAAAQAPIAEHTTEQMTTSTDTFTAGALVTPALTIGAVAIAQNQYRGGYLKIEGGTNGIGQIVKLRSHAFWAASATTVVLPLMDTWVTTSSGTETFTLLANPWANVVINPTTAVTMAVGVTMVNFAAAATASVDTSGYEQTATTTWTQPRYGWLQTWGLASVLLDTSALVAGHGVGLSGITAGACAVAVETDIEQRIGVSMEAMGTDNIYASVFLQIAP